MMANKNSPDFCACGVQMDILYTDANGEAWFLNVPDSQTMEQPNLVKRNENLYAALRFPSDKKSNFLRINSTEK
jgi:hypothetical protein